MVVDACQGRFKREMLNDLDKSNAITLITGSKFYRGPPFSGAVIVPGSIMEELKRNSQNNDKDWKDDSVVPTGLNSFFGINEIPRELPDWRESLFDNQNPALAIRWAAALAEIEKTLAIDEDTLLNATKDWRKAVIEEVNSNENLSYFEEGAGTDSIISIRVKHPNTGKWMNKSEL